MGKPRLLVEKCLQRCSKPGGSISRRDLGAMRSLRLRKRRAFCTENVRHIFFEGLRHTGCDRAAWDVSAEEACYPAAVTDWRPRSVTRMGSVSVAAS